MTAPLRHLSVCSGIGAPDLAWGAIGLSDPVAFAEIEAFPAAVLAARFPGTPNLGDMTRWREWPDAVLADADILVGGTPCQSFSVAGKRRGLADERGNLALVFIAIADAIDDLRRALGRPPCWICWENVPGVLSDKDNAFGAFLGGLCGGDAALDPAASRRPAGVVVGPDRCAAWRVLDARHFGVAQRRRRVFLLARRYAGAPDWGPADALCPLRDGGDWHPAPGGETREDAAGPAAACFGGNRTGGSQGGAIDVSPALNAHGGGARRLDFESEAFVVSATGGLAHALTAEGFDAREDGSGRGCPVVAFSAKDHGADAMADLSPTLRAGGHTGSHPNAGVMPAVAFSLRGRDGGALPEVEDEGAPALRAAEGGSSRPFVAYGVDEYNADCEVETAPTVAAAAGMAGNRRPAVMEAPDFVVRRLTPTECERLQGFPDGWTAIRHRGKPAADGPRYKALGNSWAVPCGRFVGERIMAVDPRCREAGA